MIRIANAVWKGGPGSGEGSVSTSSGVISKALFSFGSGTGNEPCTSPSEMLAAAVASCMALMVAQETARHGFKEAYIRVESALSLEEKKGEWHITGIQLNVTGAPEMSSRPFKHAVETAATKCPISRALRVPISLTTKTEAPLEEVLA